MDLQEVHKKLREQAAALASGNDEAAGRAAALIRRTLASCQEQDGVQCTAALTMLLELVQPGMPDTEGLWDAIIMDIWLDLLSLAAESADCAQVLCRLIHRTEEVCRPRETMTLALQAIDAFGREACSAGVQLVLRFIVSLVPVVLGKLPRRHAAFVAELAGPLHNLIQTESQELEVVMLQLGAVSQHRAAAHMWETAGEALAEQWVTAVQVYIGTICSLSTTIKSKEQQLDSLRKAQSTLTMLALSLLNHFTLHLPVADPGPSWSDLCQTGIVKMVELLKKLDCGSWEGLLQYRRSAQNHTTSGSATARTEEEEDADDFDEGDEDDNMPGTLVHGAETGAALAVCYALLLPDAQKLLKPPTGRPEILQVACSFCQVLVEAGREQGSQALLSKALKLLAAAGQVASHITRNPHPNTSRITNAGPTPSPTGSADAQEKHTTQTSQCRQSEPNPGQSLSRDGQTGTGVAHEARRSPAQQHEPHSEPSTADQVERVQVPKEVGATFGMLSQLVAATPSELTRQQGQHAMEQLLTGMDPVLRWQCMQSVMDAHCPPAVAALLLQRLRKEIVAAFAAASDYPFLQPSVLELILAWLGQSPPYGWLTPSNLTQQSEPITAALNVVRYLLLKSLHALKQAGSAPPPALPPPAKLVDDSAQGQQPLEGLTPDSHSAAALSAKQAPDTAQHAQVSGSLSQAPAETAAPATGPVGTGMPLQPGDHPLPQPSEVSAAERIPASALDANTDLSGHICASSLDPTGSVAPAAALSDNIASQPNAAAMSNAAASQPIAASLRDAAASQQGAPGPGSTMTSDLSHAQGDSADHEGGSAGHEGGSADHEGGSADHEGGSGWDGRLHVSMQPGVSCVSGAALKGGSTKTEGNVESAKDGPARAHVAGGIANGLLIMSQQQTARLKSQYIGPLAAAVRHWYDDQEREGCGVDGGMLDRQDVHAAERSLAGRTVEQHEQVTAGIDIASEVPVVTGTRAAEGASGGPELVRGSGQGDGVMMNVLGAGGGQMVALRVAEGLAMGRIKDVLDRVEELLEEVQVEMQQQVIV